MYFQTAMQEDDFPVIIKDHFLLEVNMIQNYHYSYT